MIKKAEEKSPATREESLSASVQVLPLPAGLYLFSVTAASPTLSNASGQLALPAVCVGAGPGVPSGQVEFVAGSGARGAWLFAQGDLLVAKVNAPGATLIMTSVRNPEGDVLSIKVERLDARIGALPASRSAVDPAMPAGAPAVAQPIKTVARSAEDGLPLQISVHVRARGDLTFTDLPWAGRVAPGLWIESFALRPLEIFGAQDIEYKGLTGSGFETAWISDNKACGTQGMGVPLVGFAIRLKPTVSATGYDCEYSGYFQSGAVVGPVRNGAPCRSTVASDPLEGIRIRLLNRAAAKAQAAPERTRARAAKSMRRR